jgi:hypothetical protein
MGVRLTPSRRRADQEGQGLVEFAMVIPVFVLAVVGLFDVGRLVYVNSTLSQAAREGARVAATEAAWVGLSSHGCVADAGSIGSGNPGAHVCPANVAAFDAHVVSAVNRMAVSLGPLSAVHLSCNEGSGTDPAPAGAWADGPGGDGNGCDDGAGNPIGAIGDLVSVRVQYSYQPMTPIVSSILGAIGLSGSASMVIH